jgi:hypothetical protein
VIEYALSICKAQQQLHTHTYNMSLTHKATWQQQNPRLYASVLCKGSFLSTFGCLLGACGHTGWGMPREQDNAYTFKVSARGVWRMQEKECRAGVPNYLQRWGYEHWKGQKQNNENINFDICLSLEWQTSNSHINNGLSL